MAAAARLFYRQGVRGVGVDAVAEAAGVTKKTLYYHFASKDDLVAAYLEERDIPTRINIAEAPNTRGPLPGDRVLAVFDHLERWFRGGDYHGCPFTNAVAEQSASEAVVAVAERHKEAVARWFSEQAQLGGARDPSEVGHELLVVLDGALSGALVFRSAAPAAVARRLATMVLERSGVPTTTEKKKSGKRDKLGRR